MKGSVRQRGSKWQYRFRGPERDPSTGDYPWITKGGFDTQKEAWQACREAMREADRGRVVKPSTRTVAQFFTEWFAAIEPSIDATTWQNWRDYAAAYVIPRIGGERLQRLDEPQLLKLYAALLAEGRVKHDRNAEMYAHWADLVAKGKNPTARQVSDACNTTIHAARAAVRRYKSGIIPKQMTRGLAPKTVRNIHAMIHRALVDAVSWKYINDNPASNVKPPKRPRTRRKVWKPDQIQSFLLSIQHDRFAALFLLELTTGIRRGQICGLKWSAVDLDAGESLSTTIASSSTATRGTRKVARQRTPTRQSRSIGPRLQRCATGAWPRTASESSSAPTITPATMSSPLKTAARRTPTQSDSVSTVSRRLQDYHGLPSTICGTPTRPVRSKLA